MTHNMQFMPNVLDNSSNRLYLTNDYSICSKYSAVKAGYFNDLVLEDLLENHSEFTKPPNRSPIVNRGYAARLLAVDWFVHDVSITLENVDCFIILGAGYDTLPFRRPNNSIWIELDLSQVVTKKAKFIRECKLLNGSDITLVKEGLFVSKALNYYLIACDLRNDVSVIDNLNVVLNILRSNFYSFAIINEVCLCYLEPEEVRRLLASIVLSLEARASKIFYIGFEQFKPVPNSEFSRVMTNHFHSLGYPLKYFPTQKEIRKTLFKFDKLSVQSMFSIFHKTLRNIIKEKAAFLKEPFDEFEEFDLYLSHYAVITGELDISQDSSKTMKHMSNHFDITKRCINVAECENPNNITQIESSLNRFGHSSCILDDLESSILVSGGFGCNQTYLKKPGKKSFHCRLSDAIILEYCQEKQKFKSYSLKLDENMRTSVCLDKMHGQTKKISNNLLFFNGGRQNPSKLNQKNVPFTAKLEDDTLSVDQLFKSKKWETVSCWRHKLTPVHNDKLFQVGGIYFETKPSFNPLVLWDFNSNQLFYSSMESEDLVYLRRHSFGLDMLDSNTFLIFGGLTTEVLCDKPATTNIILWDTRTNQVASHCNRNEANCYNANVHFISENLFVRLGGIDYETGLSNENVDLFDLRYLVQRLEEHSFIKRCSIPKNEEHFMLSNATSCKLQSARKLVTIGGGGNYFTFGTCFTKTHLLYSY